MADLIEVSVPDIGDFKDVGVIEILVKPGDRVKKEDPLVTLESDKATMEIPSPHPGVVKELRTKIGDKVSQGSVILLLEGEVSKALTPPQTAAPSTAGKPPPPPGPSNAPTTLTHSVGTTDVSCDLVVLGAGPGGYSAAFRAADLGMKTVLVERYPELGGVCLNVGCIPSKALLHVAAVMDEAKHLSEHGVKFPDPEINLETLRSWKEKVVGKLTTGLAGMAKARQVAVLQGVGTFVGPHRLAVETKDGRKLVEFKSAIIAAGSQSARLRLGGKDLPEDPRIVDSTGALELRSRPKRMLIVGGGIIGLEMGTVYSALGARLEVVEMLDSLMAGADRDLVKVWQTFNARRFDKLMLKTKATAVEALRDGLKVTFEGGDAPADPQFYDMILVSVGRIPNGGRIGAEAAGVLVNERGFIPVDSQMRTNVPHVFAIGDIARQPMLAHKAVHEGHIAAEAAAGEKSHFDARVIPSVAYTDPEIAWAGVTEEEARSKGVKHRIAKFPWSASGRAIANGRDEGFTKLIFSEETQRLMGGGIVGAGAGDLIGEVALAIEMGADAVDIGKTIHPHPTVSESIGMAAELYAGVCTDLPPTKRR